MDRRTLLTLAMALVVWLGPAPARAVEATSDDQNLQHTRQAGGTELTPPLALAWRHEHAGYHDVFAGAGGLVYATMGLSAGTATGAIEALDARTGRTRWSFPITAEAADGQYVDGVVIVALALPTRELIVLDARTGALRWRTTTDGEWPAVAGGRVVATVFQRVRAFRLSDGAPQWDVPSPFREYGGGLVAAGGLAVTGTYPQAHAYLPATGADRLPAAAGYPYWGRGSVAFDEGRVYTTQDPTGIAILSAARVAWCRPSAVTASPPSGADECSRRRARRRG